MKSLADRCLSIRPNRKHKKDSKTTDLSKEPYAMKQVVFHLGRYCDLDFEKVSISGEVQEATGDQSLFVRLHGKRDVRCVTFMGLSYTGFVDVKPKRGFTMEEATGLDLGQAALKLWLRRMGMPDDMEACVEEQVSSDGKIQLNFGPMGG